MALSKSCPIISGDIPLLGEGEQLLITTPNGSSSTVSTSLVKSNIYGQSTINVGCRAYTNNVAIVNAEKINSVSGTPISYKDASWNTVSTLADAKYVVTYHENSTAYTHTAKLSVTWK